MEEGAAYNQPPLQLVQAHHEVSHHALEKDSSQPSKINPPKEKKYHQLSSNSTFCACRSAYWKPESLQAPGAPSEADWSQKKSNVASSSNHAVLPAHVCFKSSPAQAKKQPSKKMGGGCYDLQQLPPQWVPGETRSQRDSQAYNEAAAHSMKMLCSESFINCFS